MFDIQISSGQEMNIKQETLLLPWKTRPAFLTKTCLRHFFFFFVFETLLLSLEKQVENTSFIKRSDG